MTDVVGLYLNPPKNAIVFCLDEKSQIQALDCTPPGLPLKKGRGTWRNVGSARSPTNASSAVCSAALNSLSRPSRSTSNNTI